MNRTITYTLIYLILVAAAASVVYGQKRRRPAATTTKPAVTAPKVVSPAKETSGPPKKNDRPAAADAGAQSAKPVPAKVFAYGYKFVQPDFTVSEITIEHDEDGSGKISFKRLAYDEPMVDPIVVSLKTLTRIKDALTALDFLNSTEDYQYARDYSHMGNITFRLSRDGKSRETKFNYSENKYAKILMDEYRKIGNQYIWIFDITVSRKNQPLEAPGLMQALDSLLRRNEISDPEQLRPLLTDLADDERIPLIARNHAGKILKKIDKIK